MDGTATLKQFEITVTAAAKSLTIHLTLFDWNCYLDFAEREFRRNKE